MTWHKTDVQPGAILAWYCSHEDEPLGARTHVSREIRRGKWVIRADKNTIRSVSGFDERPPCPRAVPVRARKRDLDRAQPPYPTKADD